MRRKRKHREDGGTSLSKPAFPKRARNVDEDANQTQNAAPRHLEPQEEATPPVYQLKTTTKKEHTSVICKLGRVCSLTPLVEEIQRFCVVMKQVQLEGSHLANLHLLRCLKDNETLPPLTQMIFYRCCMATLGNIEKRDRGTTSSNSVKHSDLYPTFDIYWKSREREPAYSSESIPNAGPMVNEMAKLMSINARNMLALEFRKRLHMYIRFRFAREGDIELEYNETKRLVDSCFRVRSVPELAEDGTPTGKMQKVWTDWDQTSDPVELQLRAWLGIVPWHWQIRENTSHFLRRLYEMLAWLEEFVEEHPKTKGARLYSLLPISTSFRVAYVKLNTSTLYDIFKRIATDPEIEECLSTEMNIDPHWTEESTMLAFSAKTFQDQRSV